MFIVGSLHELEQVESAARKLNKEVNLPIRVNSTHRLKLQQNFSSDNCNFQLDGQFEAQLEWRNRSLDRDSINDDRDDCDERNQWVDPGFIHQDEMMRDSDNEETAFDGRAKSHAT